VARTPAQALLRTLGLAIVQAAPWLMKSLSVVGTAAMFLVGGGILVHGIPALHHAIAGLGEGAGGPWHWLLPAVCDALVGVVAGALVLAGVALVQRLRRV